MTHYKFLCRYIHLLAPSAPAAAAGLHLHLKFTFLLFLSLALLLFKDLAVKN